jgi:hypothetical protein
LRCRRLEGDHIAEIFGNSLQNGPRKLRLGDLLAA